MAAPLSGDQAHIRRIRQALARLKQARTYQQQASRLVKDAELGLRAAVDAAQRPLCAVREFSRIGEDE